MGAVELHREKYTLLNLSPPAAGQSSVSLAAQSSDVLILAALWAV